MTPLSSEDDKVVKHAVGIEKGGIRSHAPPSRIPLSRAVLLVDI